MASPRERQAGARAPPVPRPTPGLNVQVVISFTRPVNAVFKTYCSKKCFFKNESYRSVQLMKGIWWSRRSQAENRQPTRSQP